MTRIQKLRKFGGDHYYRKAVLSELPNEGVDLVFCANIYACGRIVQKKDLGTPQKPSSQDHLLLVAAAQ